MKHTRRFFLKTTGALAAYTGIAPLDLVKGMEHVEEQAVAAGKTLVVIFLRGGMDGLNFIIPFRDSAYYELRSSIAIAQPDSGPDSALDLDGFFALHPRAAALQPMFESNLAVALQAVGYDRNTRSHFEEQDTWETGVIGNTINSDGWLNRHLLTSKGNGPIRAVSIGNTLPRILQGNAPAYAIRGLTDIKLPGATGQQEVIAAALEHAYTPSPQAHVDPARDLLSQTGRDTLSAIRQLRAVSKQPYNPDVQYPGGRLGNGLREVARLIKADVGLEVAEVDYGGWDTHNNQGGVGGSFGNLVQGLADAVRAFTLDLEDRMDDILLLTLSDFGRTARENGSSGTDHGWANCMLAVGGTVRKAQKEAGRRVIGRWPGLEPSQLNQGRDLLHTTDFRDVLGEIVREHLGNPNLASVLPDHEFKPIGLV
jgi:uncharacterized protein (DUF1501 family)